MKVLTLTQPWASLVAMGHKKIETRSWYTNYRGSVAIQAAKEFPKGARDIAASATFQAYLNQDASALPVGVIVAFVNLTACRSTNPPFRWDMDIPYTEKMFGNYTPDRWMFHLEDLRTPPTPISVKGKLGLWKCDDPQVRAAYREIGGAL